MFRRKDHYVDCVFQVCLNRFWIDLPQRIPVRYHRFNNMRDARHELARAAIINRSYHDVVGRLGRHESFGIEKDADVRISPIGTPHAELALMKFGSLMKRKT